MSVSVVTALFVGASILFFWGKTPSSYFANYEETRLSGVMDRGWIPSYIPRSSTEINERHSIDSNWVEMSFEYDVNDKSSIKANCTIVESNEKVESYNCEYFGNAVHIDLFSNGHAELRSVHKTAFNN